MKEVLPGIYQMTLTLEGFGSGAVNTYLIRDNDGYVIIDTGWDAPEPVNSMETQLATASINFSEIKKVILTHCHIDHLGMADRFKKMNNADIYIHRDELDLIKVRYNSGYDYWNENDKFLRSHGLPESEIGPADSHAYLDKPLLFTGILLKGGEIISAGEYNLTVIPTPGHTPGHISLYESRNKYLFSGDILLPTILSNAAGHIQHMQSPVKKYLDSLSVLRQLEVDFVLPGHEYIFSNHQKRIDEITHRYQQKIAMAARSFDDNRLTMTAYDVARRLPWTPRIKTVYWDQLNDMNKRFALLQSIALLEELANMTIVIRFSQDGKIQYKLNPCNNCYQA
jgi:glyoxylase-like metal-dependent hydrolase (beta-lactamase superfamily II)